MEVAKVVPIVTFLVHIQNRGRFVHADNLRPTSSVQNYVPDVIHQDWSAIPNNIRFEETGAGTADNCANGDCQS